jgi:hypothetical protein
MLTGGLEHLNKRPLERVTPLFGHAGNRQRPGRCCYRKASTQVNRLDVVPSTTLLPYLGVGQS